MPPLPARHADFHPLPPALRAAPHPGSPPPLAAEQTPSPGTGRYVPPHRPRPKRGRAARSGPRPSSPPRGAAELSALSRCGTPGRRDRRRPAPHPRARPGPPRLLRVPDLCSEASAVRPRPPARPGSSTAAMPAARCGPRRAALRPLHRGAPSAMSRPLLGTFSAPLASSSHGATLLLRPHSLPASSPPFPALHAGAEAARHSGSSPAADMATLTAVQPLTLDRGKRGSRPAAAPRPAAPAAPAPRALPGGRRGRTQGLPPQPQLGERCRGGSPGPAVRGAGATGCGGRRWGGASRRGSGGRAAGAG